MAEDRFNPLNNPDATPVRQDSGGRHDAEDTMPESSQDEFDAYIESELGFGVDDDADDDASEIATSADTEPGDEGGKARGQKDDLESPAVVPPEPSASGGVEPRWQVGNELLTAREIIEKGHFSTLMSHFSQQSQQAPQQPDQPQLTPEILERESLPAIENLVNNGWIEASFADNYPRAMTGFVYLLNRVSELEQKASQAYNYSATQTRQQEIQSTEQMLGSLMDEVAGMGGIFESLKEKDERDKYKQYLIEEVNPQMSKVDKKNLAKWFLSYNSDLVEKIVNGSRSTKRKAPPGANLTGVENGSAHMRGSQQTAPTEEPWADMLNGILPGH